MSDELERRLREAGHRLPGPTTGETRSARGRVLAARPRSRRRLLPALVTAVALAGAFGVGYGVASGGKPKPRLIVKQVPARLNAGPGFLPADGWTTAVAIDPSSGQVTHATATSANGIRIDAAFTPASSAPGLPQRLLPLQLPRGGHLRAHVGAYAVDARVTFSSAPAAGALAAAREELGRLVVPSCPAARPLRSAGGAALFVLRWLPAHYAGSARDLAGARASGALGRKMPRHGEAAADCGAAVAARSVEVDVVLPRVAKVSASLSQLTYFVARTTTGWTVWGRAR